MQLHTTLIASAQLHEKLRCARCRPWKQWITAASTKETKQFPRNELISTYSYRHGCPRYSLSHTVDVIDSPFFFSLLFNFSSITVSSAHLFPIASPPVLHQAGTSAYFNHFNRAMYALATRYTPRSAKPCLLKYLSTWNALSVDLSCWER